MDNATPRVQLRITANSIERLLSPQSVAIVGASDKPGALGASVLANLDRNGYAGEVYLINPKRETIGARTCLTGIEDLPDGVDVAVLAIPRPGVLAAVTSLAQRKCGAVVIFSAGFAEGGDAGLGEQREIARIATEAGMIVEGPNCLGMVNFVDGIPLTFVETQAEPMGALPGIGIVSQSGAMACVLAVTIASRSLGLSYSISTGNEAASGVEDYVDYLIEDANTRVITLIVEQFRKPKRFLEAARRAHAKGKTIVLLHPGKSRAARESAATHTGALAGDYAVMRAKVGRAGVVFAESLEELADIAEVALRCRTLPHGGTAVLGESGAFKALTLDLCEELDVALPQIHDADSPALRAALPEFVGVSNPLDLTAQGLVEPDLYYRTLEALFSDDRFGAIVLGIIQTDPVTMNIKVPPILRALKEIKPTKPVIFAGLDEGADVPSCMLADLRKLGVPCFPSTERAFRAIKRLTATTETDLEVRTPRPVFLSLPPEGGVIPEHLSKSLLAKLGVPVPHGQLARTLKDAIACAEAIGYPVVLKAQSKDLSHKSDIGGVIVGIKDSDALTMAWARLHANIAAGRPDLALDGVLVETMSERGIELIIGAKADEDWGAVILVGFGGVTAELLQDVRILTPDMTQACIISELAKLKQAPLLTGFRGSPAVDIEAVAQLILLVADLFESEPALRELDLNPVIAYPKPGGVIALDALMYTAPSK